ncbi:unnamed protein product [Phytophthora lilii]|uniref:Unnamed protein product n=1 Tax=Phytophthora lilii TaxID=2077276 RepID=A0A9W6U5Z1_9STRA|nr:unnamed protein product [Phytophthora lilii]
MFQKHAMCVLLGVLQQGIENYRLLTKSGSKPSWIALTSASNEDDIPNDIDLKQLVEAETDLEAFDPHQPLSTTLKEVEAIKCMRFDPRIQMAEPLDLYNHNNGSTETQVPPKFIHIFTHSASSSFLAYFPYIFGSRLSTK